MVIVSGTKSAPPASSVVEYFVGDAGSLYTPIVGSLTSSSTVLSKYRRIMFDILWTIRPRSDSGLSFARAKSRS